MKELKFYIIEYVKDVMLTNSFFIKKLDDSNGGEFSGLENKTVLIHVIKEFISAGTTRDMKLVYYIKVINNTDSINVHINEEEYLDLVK